MQIKTAEGEKNVASQAVAGTALGLAIPGTLAFLGNILGGGALLANGYGANYNGMPSGYAQRNTTEDTRVIGQLFAELSKEKSERYADNNGIALYKEIITKINADNAAQDAKYTALATAVAAIDKQVAVDKQATVDNFAFLNNKIDTTKNEIVCYCNATFVPGKLVMPLDSICPAAQPATTTTTTPTT